MREIAIAGGSGFVGTHIRTLLAGDYRFRGLTRSETLVGRRDIEKNTEWRACDLFSLPQVETALEGVSTAIYLVHSMLPSARLNQSSFADLDLLIADNFARAAKRNGLSQIIYVGGIIPDVPKLSPHLASRLEVERVLASRGTPVTRLRTGLIVGPGGSSLRMLVNLTRRLPVMVLPRWVRSKTVVLSIEDLVASVQTVLENPEFCGGCFDLGSGESLRYRDLIATTARTLKRKPLMVDVPIQSPAVSKLWVRLFSGASPSLVNPLVESLSHGLTVKPNPLQDSMGRPRTFEESLMKSIDAAGRVLPNPRQSTLSHDLEKIRAQRRVRSVQRLPLPEGWDAGRTADAYFKWLSRVFGWLMTSEGSVETGFTLKLRIAKNSLLDLEASPLTPGEDRKVFYIRGGLLANARAEPPGRFEFRKIEREGSPVIITAIHAYQPRLPWVFYNLTQAFLHLWVMRSFGRYLRRQIKRETAH